MPVVLFALLTGDKNRKTNDWFKLHAPLKSLSFPVLFWRNPRQPFKIFPKNDYRENSVRRCLLIDLVGCFDQNKNIAGAYTNNVTIMLLSDPKYSDYYFFIILDSGGEEKTAGPEGQQFLNIVKSISPIVK